MSHAEINYLSDMVAALYEKMLKDSRLAISQTYQIIIRGSLDLYHQQLTESAIDNYHQHFKHIDPERYEREAGKLLGEFFASRGKEFNPTHHFNVVRATYVGEHREDFWKLYWSNFNMCIFNEQRVDNAVKVLDYWFNAESYFSGSLPYFIPDFFIKLPEYFEEVKKAKAYNQIKDKLEARLRSKQWYDIINPILNDRTRKGIFGIPKLF